MFLVEVRRPRVVREHPRAGWFAVGTVCFGAFMGQLDASIVTLTFPAVQTEFGARLAAVQWVSLSYLLALVGLLATVGRIADAVGRKLTYVHGFAVFTLASVACGLAPSLGWLVAFRVVQAVGAAMLQANSVALVVRSVPAAHMRRALGVQAAAQALGLAVGPAVGGVLVASMGWRWVFLVNLPVGLLGWLAGRWLLPRTRERTPVGRLDAPGVLLLASAATAALLALSGVSGLPMPWQLVAVLALAAVAAAVGFVLRQRITTHPLIDPAVLRSGGVPLGLLGALCGYLTLFGPLALLPQTLRADASIGLLLTTLPAGFAFAAVGLDRLLPEVISIRARGLGGALGAILGCGLLIAGRGSPTLTAAALIVLGLGLGVFIPANNAAIMRAIPARMSATGGGLVNMARGLGTALGIAVVTLCLHARLPALPTSGYVLAAGALAVTGLLAGATALAVRPARSQGTADG